MNPRLEQLQNLTRRHFLGKGAHGLGALALGSLLRESLSGSTPSPAVIDPLAPRAPHYAPKAKRVIYLHLTGSPPHLDLYDYKPELVKRNGQDCPDAFLKGKRFAFTSGVPKLLGTPRKFAQHGKGGVWLSDAIPHLHSVADELCVIKSMTTDQFNHAPAELLVYTGSPRPGRPSIGSWVTYGLGTENQNLPGFVVLISSGVQPNGGRNSFGSGFLPSVYQGVQCRSKGDPVLYASDPDGLDRNTRRLSLDVLRDLNEMQARELGHPETATRIAQYELAFKMQASVPELADLSSEPQSILDLYGVKQPGDGSFASNCLLARRLIERGTRFVQLYHRGWDHHGDLDPRLRQVCKLTDQPAAALVKDLKQRGLLEDTLVIWGGEFGRTPMGQGSGRDHHINAFSIWMAGAGIRGGLTWGSTDELGYRFLKDGQEMHVHDLHATMLATFGIDHTRLVHRYQGRDFRLTDVHGKVATGIFG